MLAQAAWLPVLRALGAQVWSAGRLSISQVDRKFDSQGCLADTALRTRLETYLHGFAAFVAGNPVPGAEWSRNGAPSPQQLNR